MAAAKKPAKRSRTALDSVIPAALIRRAAQMAACSTAIEWLRLDKRTWRALIVYQDLWFDWAIHRGIVPLTVLRSFMRSARWRRYDLKVCVRDEIKRLEEKS